MSGKIKTNFDDDGKIILDVELIKGHDWVYRHNGSEEFKFKVQKHGGAMAMHYLLYQVHQLNAMLVASEKKLDHARYHEDCSRRDFFSMLEQARRWRVLYLGLKMKHSEVKKGYTQLSMENEKLREEVRKLQREQYHRSWWNRFKDWFLEVL